MNPVVEIKHYLGGYFYLHVGKVDAEGNEIPGTRRKVAEFPNLITDNGMDGVNSCPGGAFGFQYVPMKILVGSGNTAPTVTDSSLETLVAISANIEGGTCTYVSAVDPALPYWKQIQGYRFNAGTATGNLAEVGTGWAASDLFSRALILDGGGSPTTITVLADEYLDVTFEKRTYIPTADVVTAISISSVIYSVTLRPYDIDTPVITYDSLSSPRTAPYSTVYMNATGLVALTNTQPGGQSNADTVAYAAYTPGTWYRDVTVTYGLSRGNAVGGILVMGFGNPLSRYQMLFDPVIPKDGTKILTITMRTSWARYTP